MEFIYIAIFIIFAAFIIFWIHRTGRSQIEDLKKENAVIKGENNDLQNKHLEFVQEISQLRANLEAKEEQFKLQQSELQNTREQLNKDFQVLANQILEEKTSRLRISIK